MKSMKKVNVHLRRTERNRDWSVDDEFSIDRKKFIRDLEVFFLLSQHRQIDEQRSITFASDQRGFWRWPSSSSFPSDLQYFENSFRPDYLVPRGIRWFSFPRPSKRKHFESKRIRSLEKSHRIGVIMVNRNHLHQFDWFFILNYFIFAD